MTKAAHSAAVASLLAGIAAVATATWAFLHWSSGSPGPGLLVSVGCCIFGALSAWLAEAVGSERRTLRVGLAGLVVNLLVGAMWFLLVLGALASG